MTETVTQLAAAALSTTLTTTLYTVPASTTTILTVIQVANTNTTTTRNVTMDAAGGMNILTAEPIPPAKTRWFYPRIPLTAAQLIRGGQDTGTDVEVVLGGVQIT